MAVYAPWLVLVSLASQQQTLTACDTATGTVILAIGAVLSPIGAVLGGVAASGAVLAVLASPPMRRPTLADRIAPYLADTTRASRLLARTGTGTAGALGRLTAPLLRDAVRPLDRIVGGQASVRRRLESLDSPMTVE